MRILDHTGDTTVAWDVQDVRSTSAARAKFSELRREGRTAFERAAGARDVVITRDFDPVVEEIIWIRPIQGG